MTNLTTIVHDQRQQFLAVLSDSTIVFDREAEFALQVIGANQYLAGIAGKNPQSLQNAIVNVAAVGISLNPAAKLAYLVPRDGKVCLDISYMGLMHIAQQSGAIQWGQSQIVRKNDVFQLDGIDRPPKHVFDPFGTERGEIVGAYVVVKTDTGDYLTHAMAISKIHDIRNRSSAWLAYQKDKSKKNPWVTDEEEMIKKTVIKQAAKMWPRRDRLDTAIHNLNTDGEGIAFVDTPTMDDEVVLALIAAIEAADTKDAAKDAWRAGHLKCKEANDLESAGRLKKALLAHGAKLDETIEGEAHETTSAS